MRGMTGSRLVFCETERKVVGLSRGWRTPDPSPTRDAAGLPGCGLRLCLEDDLFGDGTCSSSLKPLGHQSKRSATPPRQQQRGGTPGRPSRTPSPSPIANNPSDRAEVAPSRWAARKPFESPQAEASWSPIAGHPCKISLDSLTYSAIGLPQQAANNARASCDKDTSLCQPCVVPMPREMMVQPQLPAFPSIGSASLDMSPGGTVEFPPSVGSFGHPHHCAEACKYARKKRGCKEGTRCDRCHLCEWKRCGGTKKY